MDSIEEVLSEGPSFGQERVSVSYRLPATTDELRNKFAELIDFLKAEEDSRTTMTPEVRRLYALAYTTIEEACMWSIKAVNK